MDLRSSEFGEDFVWGVSSAAYQTEGAHNLYGKGPSVWDVFSNRKGKIFKNHNGNTACDFYHRFEEDLEIMRSLQIKNFRFSIAWSRVLPSGTGEVNQNGIDFYNNLIDKCLEHGITPWITLYHWDLPFALELKGGWTNREIINWFSEYVALCARIFGDRVKKWMVINEPMVFTGAGYFLGVHAPGRRGISNFLPAMHHAALCQAAGGRVLRTLCPDAEIGTTFSCSHIEPLTKHEKHVVAALKIDALLNRLYIEPVLGMGYPLKELGMLGKVEKHVLMHDERDLAFDFDFIGVQNYTREVVKHSWLTPVLRANIVKANKRKVPTTLMNWEVYPESIYNILKKFSAYPGIKKLMVTENGAAFHDQIHSGKVNDVQRMEYIRDHIAQVKRAKEEGVNVQGYFVWTFTDNFEWAEGYHPRFGIVHVDFATQQRIVKESGRWYRDFLSI